MRIYQLLIVLYQEHFSGHSELDSIYIYTKVYLGRLGS